MMLIMTIANMYLLFITVRTMVILKYWNNIEVLTIGIFFYEPPNDVNDVGPVGWDPVS